MDYSALSFALRTSAQLPSPSSVGTRRRIPVAKNVIGRSPKSPYRDGAFRPLFRLLDDLERSKGEGDTSVIYALPTPTFSLIPSSPYRQGSTDAFTVLKLDATTLPLVSSTFVPEELTSEEQERDERFWRRFSTPLPHLRQHRAPAPWRELSDMARLEWLHHALRHAGTVHAFSLDLRHDVESKARANPSAVQFLFRRIARELKQALGRSVDFWMALDLSDAKYVHVHGELRIDSQEAKEARGALRRAGGEWRSARQHQAHTRASPSVVWVNYCASQLRADGIRPSSGRLASLHRPITGEWFAATKNVRSQAEALYAGRRDGVSSLMSWLTGSK